MRVPGSRLIAGVAWLGVPLCTLVTFTQSFGGFAAWSFLLLVLLVVVDAIRCPNPEQMIEVQSDPVVRGFRKRKETWSLKVRTRQSQRGPVRLGLPLPVCFEADEGLIKEVQLPEPESGDWRVATWEFRPLRRGRFPVAGLRVAVNSPWGLWEGWGTLPLGAEIRVYPDLRRDRAQAPALFLTRGGHGVRARRQTGRGREFEKLREYVAGDGLDEIHWKATARRGHPVTKVFQIERTQEVYVLVDASRLGARLHGGPDGLEEPILERCLNAALMLCLAAERQGDHFGLVTFADQVHRFLRARRGAAHFQSCQEALVELQPRPVNPDFRELASFLRSRLGRRALLVVLTQLDDPVLSEDFVRQMQWLSRQHLVLVQMVRPAGVNPLFLGERPGNIEEVYRNLGGHLRWQNLRQLEVNLHRLGIRFHLVEEERLVADTVSRYLEIKERQLL